MNEKNAEINNFITKLEKAAKEIDDDFKKLPQQDQQKVIEYLKMSSPSLLGSFLNFLNK